MKTLKFGSNAAGRRKYRRYLLRHGQPVSQRLIALSQIIHSPTRPDKVTPLPTIKNDPEADKAVGAGTGGLY